MANEAELGTARVYLDIDATDWETAVARSKNSVAGLGTAAEQAFDNATKAQRKAATQLLTYTTGLGKTADQQRVLNALMKGVPVDIAKAAAEAIERIRTAESQAADEAERFNAAFGDATGINKARDALDQYVASLEKSKAISPQIQAAIDAGVDSGAIERAVSALNAYEQKQREQINIQNQVAAASEEAAAIDRAFNEQRIESTQRYLNQLLGVKSAQEETSSTAARRADAESAFVRILEEEANAYTQAATINEAYDQQRAESAQREINALLKVSDAQENSAAMTRRRADAISALSSIVQQEAEAEAKANQQRASGNSFIQQLENEYKYANLTHYELLEVKAAELGVAAEAGPLIEKLKLQAQQMRNGTITAKQYQFALRGLPAQFTDIFTSLAAGQSPLLVFLQQGGQIKDMFGGIATAAKATGAQLLKLATNPYVLVAAAIAAIGYAVYEGNKQLDDLREKAIASGGALGVNAQQMNEAAVAAGRATGKWSEARDAIKQLADAGLGGAGIGSLAVTIADVAKVTGQSVEQIVSDFKSLETKPAESVAKLNEQYHFLTAAQFSQIQALEEVGRTNDAARLAEKAYSDAMRERASEVDANAGWIVRSAHAVRDAWYEAWNSINNADAPKGLGDQVKEVQDQLDAIKVGAILPNGTYQAGASDNDPRVKALMDKLADLRRQQWQSAVKAAETQDNALRDQQSIAAQQSLAKYADPATKLENALKVANENRLRALAGVVDPAARAKIEEEAKEQIRQAQDAYKSATNKRSGKDTIGDATAAIKADAAAQQAVISAQTQFVQGQFQLRQISIEDYYSKLEDLARQSTAVELDSLNKQIAYDKTHGASREKILSLESQILSVQEKGAAKQKDLAQQEAQALKQRQEAIDAYVEGLQASTRALAQSLNAQAAHVGMGEREYEVYQKVNDIYNQQTESLIRLQQQYAKDGDKVKYEKEKQALLDETRKKVDAVSEGYANLEGAEQNVFNGMQASISNFIQSAQNLSGNFESTWSDALGSIGEAASKNFTGIGRSFSDLGKSIEATAIKTLTNAAVSKLLQYLLGAYTMNTPIVSSSQISGNLNSSVNSDISGFTFNAKGGMYSSPSLGEHLNSILTSPTVFAFAKGGMPNLGVAGEAGSEAIMPVTRDSNGVLGVRFYGGGASTPTVNVTINGAPSAPEVTSKRNANGGVDIEVLFKQVDQAMAAGISGGTSQTGRAIKSRFQLKG